MALNMSGSPSELSLITSKSSGSENTRTPPCSPSSSSSPFSPHSPPATVSATVFRSRQPYKLIALLPDSSGFVSRPSGNDSQPILTDLSPYASSEEIAVFTELPFDSPSSPDPNVDNRACTGSAVDARSVASSPWDGGEPTWYDDPCDSPWFENSSRSLLLASGRNEMHGSPDEVCYSPVQASNDLVLTTSDEGGESRIGWNGVRPGRSPFDRSSSRPAGDQEMRYCGFAQDGRRGHSTLNENNVPLKEMHETSMFQMDSGSDDYESFASRARLKTHGGQFWEPKEPSGQSYMPKISLRMIFACFGSEDRL